MDIDVPEGKNENNGCLEKLQTSNTTMAIEMIAEFLRYTVTSRLLYLVSYNRVSNWHEFVQRLQVLGENSLALKHSKLINSRDLLELASDTRFRCYRESKVYLLWKSGAIMDFGSLAGLCHGASLSSLWLPLDLVFEDAMDGYQVNPTSAIEIITGLAKTLKRN